MSEKALHSADAKVLDNVSSPAWPAYPQYKDSGVAFTGRVPSHWETWKVVHGFQKIGSGTTPKSDDRDYYDGDIPWVTTSELRENIITETKQSITEQALRDYSTLKKYTAGTLLIAMYGATIGRMGILDIEATVNQACCAFSGPKVFDNRFLYYWLWMRRPILINLSQGGGQPNLSQDDLRSLRVPIPPITEQSAISSFLDRETARIDALIAKKQRLIELLQEKRTALISQAVTKGLDPGVPMKDFGVEWLGEIPAHWELSRIKFIVTTPVTDGPHETPEILSEGIPFVSAEAINSGKIDFSKIRGHISEEDHKKFSKKYCPKIGDIYMVKSGATTGRVAMVEDDRVFNIWSPLAAIRCNSQLVSRRFVYHYLQSKEFQTGVQLRWSFGTQQNIGMGVIQNLAVPLPSLNEQSEIATTLDRETVRFDAICSRVRVAVTKLVEYRSALITAAVTGKIDVRKVGGSCAKEVPWNVQGTAANRQ